MFVLRARLVMVEAKEDVNVVAFDNWARLRMNICVPLTNGTPRQVGLISRTWKKATKSGHDISPSMKLSAKP